MDNKTTHPTSEDICMTLVWMLNRKEIEDAHMITVYRALQEELEKRGLLPTKL